MRSLHTMALALRALHAPSSMRPKLTALLALVPALLACEARVHATPHVALSPVRAPWARYLSENAPAGALTSQRVQNDVPSRPHDFTEAKRRLYQQVYTEDEVRLEVYCGCPFDARHAIDPSRCGYEPEARSAARASRVEWDHVMPVSRFGRLFPCYHDDARPRGQSRRTYCVANDPELRALEGDMHNLFPALGQVNALREDYELGEIEGEAHIGGCDFEIDRRARRAEPRERVRGDLARAYLYMHVTYRIPLTQDERERYLGWHRADPPDPWERERNARIARIQGNENPFISRPELGASASRL